VSRAGEKMKITVISDSLTNDEPENWLSLLPDMAPGITVAANAHGGWTTHSFFKEKFRDAAFTRVEPDTDVFILLVGSNNIFEDFGGSDEAVRLAVAGVERIAGRALALAPRAGVLLAAPPNVALANVQFQMTTPPRRILPETPFFLAELGAEYQRLAGRRGWMFVNLFPLLEDVDFADAAHPNPAGNRKIAAAVLKTLIEGGCIGGDGSLAEVRE